MNLVEKGKELEYVPEPKLIEMARNPEGQYPQFLVLSEIQKRNQMRRMYKNQMAKMNQPTTTVAEESVMELAGQGAVPMMDSLSSLSSPEGGLRSMAPTLMKSGKKTEIEKDETELSEELRELLAKDRRYAQQYKDYESRERFFPPLVPENFIVSDDKYDRLKRSGAYMREGNLQDYRPFLALLGALSGESGPRYMPESKVKGLQAMIEATRKEKQMQQMGMQEGGITQMQSGRSTALEQSFMPPGRNELPMSSESASSLRGGISNIAKTLGLIDEEGNIDPVQASLLGLSFVPGVGLVAGAGRLGLGVAKFLAPKAKSFFMKPNPVLSKGLQPGQRVIVDPKKGKTMIQSTGKDSGKIIPETVADVSKIATTAGVVSSPFAVSNIFAPDESTEPVVEELTPEQKEIKRLQDLLAEANKPKDESEPVKKGLGSDDFLTLAQLGGILGGATNLGEAAMGIGNLAGQIQTTRRASKLEGLQGKLLEAQAAKYIADVANMDLNNALQQYSALPKLVESGVLTPEEAKIREAALIQRINEFQGTATNTSQKSYSQFVS